METKYKKQQKPNLTFSHKQMVSKKSMIVFKHEFKQKVKSKGYIIFTFLGPILLSLLFVIPVILSTVDTGDQRVIAIVDSTGKLAPFIAQRIAGEELSFEEELNNAKSQTSEEHAAKQAIDATIKIQIEPLWVSVDTLRSKVMSGQLTGFLVIPANAIVDSTAKRSTLRLRNTNDFSIISEIRSSYSEALRNEKLKAKGIDPDILQDIDELSKLETLKVSDQGETEDRGGTFLAGYLTGFLMYFSLLIYGAMILRSVVEEKSTRVIEIMVSSVKPYDLLIGKVLGISAAAVLQMSVWAAMLALLATVGVKMASSMTGSQIPINIPPELFIYFVVYFVLGFLIYSTLYAALGATADQESDVQQASMPITLLVIVPFLFMTSIIQAPSSTMSVVFSMIPFFSPILMMGRIFSETPPFWQIALSMAIMIGTFFAVLWVAARIYRTGILMYGKRFSPKEIFRWLRYS